MTVNDLNKYITDCTTKGMVKINLDVDTSSQDSDNLYVVRTKETYNVLTEGEADKLIEDATQDRNCVGHTKKFKQGKADKNGNMARPDMYIVEIKYNMDA